jgi:hypothetical protein
VLTPTDLLFLSGWDRKELEFEAGITKLQPTNLIDQGIFGLIEAFYFYTNDYTTTVTITIDDAIKTVEVLSVYLAGYTEPNNQMPYISMWDPEGGTGGNFVVAWNPAIMPPVHEHIAVTAQLGSDSTQEAAIAYTQILMVNVHDKNAFMESARALGENVFPTVISLLAPAPSPSQPQPSQAPPATAQPPATVSKLPAAPRDIVDLIWPPLRRFDNKKRI